MNTDSKLNRYKKNRKRAIPAKSAFIVLSKGFLAKFGIFFFFAIAILYIPFTPSFKDFKFSDDSPVIKGKITKITKTGSSIGNNKIYKYEFEYTVSGIKYHSESHFSGKKKNDTVTVEYLVDNPSISRIKGMTVGVISSGSFFIILSMQLIGLIMFLLGFFSNLWTLKLMKIGQVAFLKVTSKEEIIKNRTAYFELKYFFIDVDNQKIESVHQSINDYFDYAWIMYNPRNPDDYINLYTELRKIIPGIEEEIKEAEKRHSSYQEMNKEEESKNIEDYDNLEDKIKILLKSKDIDKAVNLAEEELKKVPETGFHKVLGKNLLNDELIFATRKAIDDFDKSVRASMKNKLIEPVAYMCKIRDFEDEGKIIYDLSSYKKKKSKNLEWLNDMSNVYDMFETKNIEYFTEVTDYFKKITEDSKYYKPENEKAYAPCEILLILRIIELFTEVYKNSDNHNLNNVPMYISGDENFLLYKIN